MKLEGVPEEWKRIRNEFSILPIVDSRPVHVVDLFDLPSLLESVLTDV